MRPRHMEATEMFPDAVKRHLILSMAIILLLLALMLLFFQMTIINTSSG
jgi:hypothetical protein